MLKVIDTAVPVACWSCSVAHNESTLFCPHCSKIQPPPGGDYFSVFGLEPRLTSICRRWSTSFIASAASCTPIALPAPERTRSNGAWPTRRCSTTPIAPSKIPCGAPNTCSSCTERRLAHLPRRMPAKTAKTGKILPACLPICSKKSSISTCSLKRCAGRGRWAKRIRS